MANLLDPWLSRDLHISKTVFNHLPKTCKSSQVTGRKINNGCLALKSPKIKKFHPSIVLLQTPSTRRIETSRSYATKKSSCRSLSLNKICIEKETIPELPAYLSPPRKLRHKKEKIKQSSQAIEIESKPEKPKNKIKAILTESLYKIYHEKQESVRRENEEKLKLDTKREKLKIANEKIRKKNLKTKKSCEIKHPKPWGVDQRIFKDSSDAKLSDNEELRMKIKLERDNTRKEGRKAIGLDLYPNVKIKHKKLNKSDEQLKTKRSPDPSVINYMKKKKKNQRVAEMQSKFEELLKEQERIRALQKLEKTQKKTILKRKKKLKSKSLWINDEEKSTDPTSSLANKREKIQTQGNDETNRDLTEEHKEMLTEQLKDLQQRISYVNDIVKTQAAITIQKWFRSIRPKLLRISFGEKTESAYSGLEKNSEGWVQVLVTQDSTKAKSDLIKEFEEKLKEKYSELEKKVLFKENSYVLDAELEKNSSDKASIVDDSLSGSLYSERIVEDQPKITKVHKVPPLSLGALHMANRSSFDSASEEEAKISEEIDNIDFEVTKARTFNSNASSNLKSLDSYNSSTEKTPENLPCEESQNSLHTFIYPVNGENTPEDSLESSEYEEGDSKSADPETSLKKILEGPAPHVFEIVERQDLKLIPSDNDSSEEEWNSNQIPSFPDIQEEQISQPVVPKSLLSEFSPELESLIESEIQGFLNTIRFQFTEKDIDPSLGFIESYMKRLQTLLELDENEMLDLINTPAYQDPLLKLEGFRSIDMEALGRFPSLELVLPQDLSAKMKIEFKALGIPPRQVYLQMVFDCINEALNYLRPFGTAGLPDPWSLKSSTLYGEGALKFVFNKLLKLISKWETVKAGSYPDENIRNDEEKLLKVREERLSVLLSQNIKDDEPNWLEYEAEETQLKIELADLIFDTVLKETLLVADLSQTNFD